jgi:hypothetical protein
LINTNAFNLHRFLAVDIFRFDHVSIPIKVLGPFSRALAGAFENHSAKSSLTIAFSIINSTASNRVAFSRLVDV